MPRIIAIDYGSRRVGFAATDPMQLIASPLTTITQSESLDFLVEYCKRELVETVVVGQPHRWSGETSFIEGDILKFILAIEKALPLVKIVRIDERFTSKLAARALIDSGLGKKKRKDKSLLDSTSAALILQSYLAQQ